VHLKVLEIAPYEPPASGWVTRIKVVRGVIQARGGVCEVLDIGPSRKVRRPGCIAVHNALDYLAKVMRFAALRFTFHGHVNAEYFRGLLLAAIALSIARTFGNRCVVTFHAGTDQPFLRGWRERLVGPVFRLIFHLSHAVICNSASVQGVLRRYVSSSKLHPIPAFSVQYLSYEPAPLGAELQRFACARRPLISTYLCFRPGFFLEVLLPALAELRESWPELGLVIVGTGEGRAAFNREVEKAGLERHVLLAGDLDHPELMSLLSASDIHLRTPTTDGVSATVLQALSLRVPVVASENGTRPSAVVTYSADDSADLAAKMAWVMRNRRAVVDSIEAVPVKDTASEEVDLLLGPGTPSA
jgi:glycosyltransferase involved in cell wall biosynthesis